MQAILNNPYRTLGLLVGATARDKDRQIRRLKAFIAAEQTPDDDFSFPSLGALDRTLESVAQAAAALDRDADKLNAALFWFWRGNEITDEPTFEALKAKDTIAAMTIWEKLAATTTVTARNASALHNLSVVLLCFAANDDDAFSKAVSAKIRLLESDCYLALKDSVADSTFRISKLELQMQFLKTVLAEIENDTLQISLQLFVQEIGKQDFAAKADFLKNISKSFIDRITAQIETSRKKREDSKATAQIIGESLYRNTKDDLEQLKSIFGEQDFSYSKVADKVANGILQCSIDFFNVSQERGLDTNYLERAEKIAKLANSVAVGTMMKGKVQESLDTLNEMKDRAIHQAVALLQSVKEAFEKNERDIKEAVNIQAHSLMYGQSINWDVVNKMIRESIAWDKVNEMLKEILSDDNLQKIKLSNKTSLKQQFITLVEWIKSKTTSKALIVGIIKKYNAIPPDLKFKIISSTVTNTGNKPLYTKYIRYIGLVLNVEVSESRTVEFFVKYIQPNGAIKRKRNDKTSPNGYSFAYNSAINPRTKTIVLSGWGNSNSCTYAVGTHSIEVYVENYLIHKKDFAVDLAHSEKLQNDIQKAEEKLAELKKTSYYVSEIRDACTAMGEIQKFHLFRSNSEKQRQIYEQERKISYLQNKADDEKKRQIANQQSVVNKYKSDLKIAIEKEKQYNKIDDNDFPF